MTTHYAALSNRRARHVLTQKIESVITDSLLTIVEWLVEHGFDSDSEEETLYCAECGSADVEAMAWSKVNEGKMFSTDIGGNNDEESNYCESCDEHPRLLTRAELTEQIDSWWEVTDTNTREKITGISISRFDGGEIPAYESACQASWDAVIDDEKIATWQKIQRSIIMKINKLRLRLLGALDAMVARIHWYFSDERHDPYRCCQCGSTHVKPPCMALSQSRQQIRRGLRRPPG